MFTLTEAIFYGDACPIIANDESIQFDDFEMDQTSVRRTTQCYVLSGLLLVASHAYICTQLLVYMHFIVFGRCMLSDL